MPFDLLFAQEYASFGPSAPEQAQRALTHLLPGGPCFIQWGSPSN